MMVPGRPEEEIIRSECDLNAIKKFFPPKDNNEPMNLIKDYFFPPKDNNEPMNLIKDYCDLDTPDVNHHTLLAVEITYCDMLEMGRPFFNTTEGDCLINKGVFPYNPRDCLREVMTKETYRFYRGNNDRIERGMELVCGKEGEEAEGEEAEVGWIVRYVTPALLVAMCSSKICHRNITRLVVAVLQWAKIFVNRAIDDNEGDSDQDNESDSDQNNESELDNNAIDGDNDNIPRGNESGSDQDNESDLDEDYTTDSDDLDQYDLEAEEFGVNNEIFRVPQIPPRHNTRNNGNGGALVAIDDESDLDEDDEI